MEKSRIKLCLGAMIRLFSLFLRPLLISNWTKMECVYSPFVFILPHQGVSPAWYL